MINIRFFYRVTILLSSSAWASKKDPSSFITHLHYTVAIGDVKMIEEALIDSSANVNVQDKCGFTPLHLAVDYGYGPCCEHEKYERIGYRQDPHWERC